MTYIIGYFQNNKPRVLVNPQPFRSITELQPAIEMIIKPTAEDKLSITEIMAQVASDGICRVHREDISWMIGEDSIIQEETDSFTHILSS
ncbi:hypothetical protein FHW36_11822 [Chitinophaga polysaccharea]|uniref:Uncharacterized protein n=1 Tax=Chitinophaga polysaccharea TaxID=1293035 RepID=A0A561P0U5_9BACT|nr:hypothetical protein [Chitinophaga polysaccharea]TWF31728.1 hypothetical protein FHW36_11822 [Chitinophaga polysaccharea]